MRFALPLLAALLLLTACGGDDRTPATGGGTALAELVITVDDDGPDGSAPARELELSCDAPTDSAACGAAAGISAADLAPTPPDQACTMIFGGPETATIKGELRGQPVDASFSRADGCEINRWDGVKDLLAHVR
jgi:hypothetical protein